MEGVRGGEEEGSVIYQHTSISKLALVNSSEFNIAFVAALLTRILYETSRQGERWWRGRRRRRREKEEEEEEGGGR